MSARTVAVILGSLRRESYSRKLAAALAALAPPSLRLEVVEIGQLPHYNEDDDGPAAPAAWTEFRSRIRAADAVLFVTPEYNRSVPGVLKNAVDVASRPRGQAAWRGKPGAVLSHSQGALGGFGANHHLRQSLVPMDVPVLQQPEAYLSRVATLFDAQGNVTSPETREFLRTFMEAFAAWIEKLAPR